VINVGGASTSQDGQLAYSILILPLSILKCKQLGHLYSIKQQLHAAARTCWQSRRCSRSRRRRSYCRAGIALPIIPESSLRGAAQQDLSTPVILRPSQSGVPRCPGSTHPLSTHIRPLDPTLPRITTYIRTISIFIGSSGASITKVASLKAASLKAASSKLPAKLTLHHPPGQPHSKFLHRMHLQLDRGSGMSTMKAAPSKIASGIYLPLHILHFWAVS
jgi:hypothetical protein